MYIYICICLCIYIYVCVCIYIGVYIYIHRRTQTHVYIYIYIYIFIYIYIYIFIYVDMYKDLFVHIHVYVCMDGSRGKDEGPCIYCTATWSLWVRGLSNRSFVLGLCPNTEMSMKSGVSGAYLDLLLAGGAGLEVST